MLAVGGAVSLVFVSAIPSPDLDLDWSPGVVTLQRGVAHGQNNYDDNYLHIRPLSNTIIDTSFGAVGGGNLIKTTSLTILSILILSIPQIVKYWLHVCDYIYNCAA